MDWSAITSIPGIGPVLPFLSAAIAICAVLATTLPPAKGPGAYATFRGIVRFVGMNFGHAPTSDPTPPAPSVKP